MSEEQYFEEVDVSDIVDDSAQYLVDSEPLHSQITDSDVLQSIIQDSEVISTEEQLTEPQTEEKRAQVQKPETVRSTRLPIARIKNIMKMDPDVSVISGDAVFLVTKATELFLETIAKETYNYTVSNKRKTIAKKDFDVVVNKVDCLCFLEGAMDF